MAILNDIKRMQAEGKTDQEIITALKLQRVSPREITEALTRSKIKEAVGEPGGYETSIPPSGGDAQVFTPGQTGTEMATPEKEQYIPRQPQEVEEGAPQYPAEQQYQQQPYQEYPQQYQQYPQQPAAAPQYPAEQQYQQQPYQEYQQGGGISPDTISEIAEQVVSEKLSPIRKDIEKVIDMKTTVESKMEYIDERLKRIEKIIHRLQLSIMQKVGDYMTNIEDIKKEIQETQKSFKSLSEQKPKHEARQEQRQEQRQEIRQEKPRKPTF